MKHSVSRAAGAAALALVSILGFSACATAAPSPAAAPAAAEHAPAFPRTLTVHGAGDEPATELTIPAEPRAIAALDYESAEVIAALGYADRLVLVPEAVLNPALGGHIEEMEQVPQTFPVAMAVDTELVIAAAPDLVVVTPRHGVDETVGSVLTQAGLTTLKLPTAWTNIDNLLQNITLLGEALGAEPAAEELTTTLTNGLTAPDGASGQAASDDPPRVLMLTNQAGRPFITAGNAFPLQLLQLAGATSVSDELGLRVTGPISVEQVMEADPDGIVLVDMNGTGDRMFSDLIDHPALADLPALADDCVLRVTGREVQALGLESTIDGLNKLHEWAMSLN